MNGSFIAGVLLAGVVATLYSPAANAQTIRQWDFPPGACPANGSLPEPQRSDEASPAYYFPARPASFGRIEYPAAVMVARVPCAIAPHAELRLTIAPLPGRETVYPRIHVIQDGIDYGCAGIAHGNTTGIPGWPGVCTDFSWMSGSGGAICDNPMFCITPEQALRLRGKVTATLFSRTTTTSFDPDRAFTLRLSGHGPADIATNDYEIPARNTPGNVSKLPAAVAGHWWNPDQPGWGMIFDRNERGVLFAAWLTYDDSGRSTWFVMPNGQESEPGVISGAVHALQGQPFSRPEAPNTLAGEIVGQFRFTFGRDGTTEKGVFRYTVNGRSGITPIERLVVRDRDGKACAPYTRGALEVLDQQGWAANIEGSAGYSNSCGTQATLLTYDDAGKPMWIYGALRPNMPRPGDSSANSALFGQLYRPSGTPYGLAWDASRFAANAAVGHWDSYYATYFDPQPLRRVVVEINGAQRVLAFRRFVFEY